MPTELRHWREWKEKCDLRGCGDETKAALTEYIRGRWRAAVRYAMFGLHGRYADTDEIDFDISWNFFEGYYTEVGQRKVYKDGLFDAAQALREGPAAAAVEREMYNHMCRAAVIFIKENYPDSRTDLFDPARQQDETETEECETESDASNMAEKYFDNLSHRERVILAARGLGLPIYAPDILADAGCGREQLYAANRQFKTRIRSKIDKDFPEKERAIGFCMMELVNRCVYWAIEERHCLSMARLFNSRAQEGNG